MREINVTLLHADWCGHCKSFKPEWQKFAKDFKNVDGVNVNDYESNDPNFADNSTINGTPIAGFPTVKISVNGKDAEYSGARKASALKAAINKLQQKIQAGGVLSSNDVQAGGYKKKVTKKAKKAKTASKSKKYKKSKTSSKSKKAKRSKSKSKSKSKAKKRTQKGGAMTEKEARELLIRKIEKYQHKVNDMYEKLKRNGVL
jgi:thiol-disulfide isomerase/thioredoxin